MPRHFTAALLATVALFSGAAAEASGSSGFHIEGHGLSVHHVVNRTMPSSAGNWLAGRHAQLQGDWDKAAQFYGDALRVESSNIEVQKSALNVYVGEGDFDQAVEIAKDLSEAQQTSMLSAMVIGSVAMQNKQYDDVLAQADLLGENGINYIVGALLKAWAYAGQGKGDLAIAALEPLASINRLAAVAALQKALIMDQLEMDGVEEAYAEATASDYASTRSVLLAAEHALRIGDRELAQNYLNLMVDAGVENWAGMSLLSASKNDFERTNNRVLTPEEGMAESFYDFAGVMLGFGDSTISLLSAQLSLFLRPNLVGAHLAVAQALGDRGDDASALGQYLYIDPSFQKYYPKGIKTSVPKQTVELPKRYIYQTALSVSRSLEALDETQRAIDVLEDYAKDWSDRPEAYTELGHLYRRAGDFKKAVSYYTKGLEKIENEIPSDWVLYYARGMSYDQIERWDLAEADLKHALELSPNEPYVLNYLGYSWIDRDQNLKEAQKMVEAAVAARPQDGHIVDSLGWALFKLGDLTRAVQTLEHAAALSPTDTVINDHLGDAYYKVGKLLQARYQWERALQTVTEDEGDEVKERLLYKVKMGHPPKDQ